MGMLDTIKAYFGADLVESQAPAKPTAGPSVTGTTTSIFSARARRGGDANQIFTIDAKSYSDAKEIAAYYREGITVVVNMADLTEPEARQLRDFMLGLQHALQGHMRRVTAKVFILTPNHIDVNDEEDGFEQEGDGLIFNPAR